MKIFARKAVLFPLTALAATLSFGIPQADAQGLFDRLFGGSGSSLSSRPLGGSQRENGQTFRAQRQVQRPLESVEPAPRNNVVRAAPAKIAAPSYYTYRADALRKVDFAPLAAIGQSASLDGTASTAFREAVSGLSGYELLAEAEAGKAIVDYYTANPDFIWVSDNDVNERGREALRVLGEAGSHGLSPVDYSLAVPSRSQSSAGDAARNQDLIHFEMTLTARVLRYISDATNGRVVADRISGYYDLPLKPIDRVAELKRLAAATDLRASLESHHPQGSEYRSLRVELEALKASAENDIVVDSDLLLKPGQESAEFPKVLQIIARDLDDEMGGEYGELLSRTVTTETYGNDLVPVIKAAQQKAGLRPDGVVGPRTVSALAGNSRADRIEKVVIALEQLRWLPSRLGDDRVFINQPAYTARYIEDGQEKLNMRVVVGKPSNQTSFFYDEIEQVDYNPYWGVPQSIIVNEMLPRLRNDPGYLDRAGYEVTDASGRRVSSSSVNWYAYGSKVPYNVRQTPSEANALGELKILFPNKHAIYMHDTPQKKLFDRDARAFSHGCVRLKDPRGMAAAVLGTSIEHVEAKLRQGHSSEKTTRKIPVYVAYFTAWPDKNGKVEYFDDVYGRDARLEAALEKTEEARTPSS